MNLHQAAANGDLATVQQLIAGGAKVDQRDGTGLTAFLVACRFDRCNVVEYLLRAGASVKAQNKQGWTGLHVAGFGGYETLAQMLIDHGGDVNTRTSGPNYTPLHMAAGSGHASVAAMLIKAGSDVNALAKGGESVKHLAARNGHTNVLQLLVQHGA